MADSDEIESFYTKAIDSADKEFLDSVDKKLKTVKEAEKIYKDRLDSIKAEYESRYASYLSQQKKIYWKNNKRKFKDEKFPQFEVKPLDMELGWRERWSMKYDLFMFRFRIKKRNFLNRITPLFLKIFFIRSRKKVKRMVKDSNSFTDRKKKRAKASLAAKGSKLKETALKIWTLLKKFFSWIGKGFGIIFKFLRDKDEEGEEEKEEEKEEKEEKKKD